ncbi:extracellular solute-binding protein [Treponema sp. OttesenSCG-928-L16]|nr:extracellular solute-binding protein [Treponema sp. OttesenSCG-928-L16]
MEKKIVFVALAYLLVCGLFPGNVYAGGGQQSTGRDSSAADYVGPRSSYSAYPLPIVEKPLELKAVGNFNTWYNRNNNIDVFNWLYDQTNIRVTPDFIQEADKWALLFASRDFPDISIGSGASAAQLAVAAEDGDILPLDDLLRQYAPTWYKFFMDNPIVKNQCSINGKIYFLPFIYWADFDRDIRDQWCIAKSFIDELGLKVPTTTEEYRNVMLAIKQNAGKGSIPQNVMPLYFKFDSYISGQFDFYGFFGVPVTNVDYLYVDGDKVIFQALNPDIKEPLKYLQTLYKDGIIPPECFTDSSNAAAPNRYLAIPSYLGSYFGYHNYNTSVYLQIPPLQSPNGKKPVLRRQAYVSANARGTSIFANNPDPIATIKFFEFIAFDVEAKMNVAWGMKDTFWKFEPGGKVLQLMNDNERNDYADHSGIGLWNSFIALWDRNFLDNTMLLDEYNIERSRPWGFRYVFKDHLIPEGSVYISAPLSVDEENMLRTYGTDLANFRGQTFSRWITTDANIDAEWDSYVAQMRRLNADAWLTLKQKAYNIMVGK